MKICLATMLSKNFIIGYIAFITSLLKNNPNFNLDFVIIDIDLNDQDRKIVKSFYKNVHFKTPNYKMYDGTNWEATNPVLRNTYYKLDIFSLYDYNRVIFIDMDTIVLSDISKLFTYDFPLAGCKGYTFTSDSFRDEINTGVIVLNKPMIKHNLYQAIVQYAKQGFSMPDQKAINRFFRGQIDFIDKKYNVEKRMLHSKKIKYKFDGSDAKIIHFVSQKPWEDNKSKLNQGFEKLENIWWNYYKMAKEDTF
ncbi:MAG: glycosyltransferase family 8 protein [bacterium]